MGRLVTAFRIFFRTLGHAQTASAVDALLKTGSTAISPPVDSDRSTVADRSAASAPAPSPKPAPPLQSEALTLLATLQREARLVDFLQEDLSAYSDDQVGAAVRNIHRDARSVLQRLFHLQPVMNQSEGSSVQLSGPVDVLRTRVTGSRAGQAAPGVQGVLRHPGWEATTCEIPQYTGSEAAKWTIAPAEVELG
jgi:hypothetical protein